MREALKSKVLLIVSMVIFGTIGIFRKNIPLPSSLVALVRGMVGTIFLLIVIAIQHKGLSWESIKKNLWKLIVSGAFIGFNWILLFEAYNFASVATATLCYYMAPIIVIVLSPFVLGEKLTCKKIVCVVLAVIGMVFVSGVLKEGIAGVAELKGILFGLSAAALYGCVILLNQKIKDIAAYDKTIMQLGLAAVVLIPYTFLTEDVFAINYTSTTLFFLFVVGIIHTGVAYAMYFGSMDGLKAQTIALFSYIDPIVAILLSALLLHEGMGVMEMIGAVLVLGATIMSEFV